MASPSVPGTKVRERAGSTADSGARWSVRADHLGTLRALVTASIGAGPVGAVDVRVDKWRRPNVGWTGQPGIAGVDEVSVKAKGDGVEAELVLRDPKDAGVVLAAVLRMLQPTMTGFPAPSWLPGAPADGLLAEHVRDVVLDGDTDPHVRRADVLLVPVDRSGDETVQSMAELIVPVAPGSWGHYDVRVDPAIHRPHGRASDAIGEVWSAAQVIDNFRAGVTMTDVKPLRSVSAVTQSSTLPPTLTAQLAALGVVLVESEDELPAREDYLAWQDASVSGRRDALREFSPWPAVAPWPTVSIVLSTHRPERLAHALAMVRAQDYPYLQVIVVLHGDEDNVAQHAPAVRQALDGWDGEWAIIGMPAERTLGHALAAASARADGELLTKMDDDDYYAPTHIWDLVLARMYSGAQIVGKALDWVYLTAADTTVFRPTYPAERFAKFVAGGTMLISAGDLAEVGGWRPVPKSVDRALLDRVLDAGGLVYRTHGLGYVYVRNAADGSANTSQVNEDHFLTKTTATFPGLLRSPALGTDMSWTEGVEP
jgi:hypothetical protein